MSLLFCVIIMLTVIQIVEKAYQQIKSFDRLSFLYLSTGSIDKLSKMQKIADARGDPMSRFHNALYGASTTGGTGAEERIAVLRDVGMYPLAYLTAKTNGFEELAEEILEQSGLTVSDIDDVPDFGKSTLRPPPVINPTTDLVWPTVSTGENFFDRVLANGRLEAGAAGVESIYANGDATGGANNALDEWEKEEMTEEIHEEDGWELEEGGLPTTATHVDEEAEVDLEEDLGAGAVPGPDETELWVRNSPLAVDHVSAGSFETAMQVCHAFQSSFILSLTAS